MLTDTPVDITVSQDLEGIVTQIQNFVESYNSIMADIAEKDRFNPDTLERGVLFGEHSVDTVRDVLLSVVRKTVPGQSSSINSLADVGIKFAPFGTETVTNELDEEVQYAVVTTPKLVFDEDKFRAAFAEDPDAAAELFTKAEVGIGDWLAERLEGLEKRSGLSLRKIMDEYDWRSPEWASLYTTPPDQLLAAHRHNEAVPLAEVVSATVTLDEELDKLDLDLANGERHHFVIFVQAGKAAGQFLSRALGAGPVRVISEYACNSSTE